MVKLTFKDKRALSLSSFTEATIGIIVILLIFAVVIIGMNVNYSQNNDPTLGLSTDSARTSLEDYQSSLQEGLGSDSSTDSINGVNVVGSWGMVWAGLSMALNFVTGGFIQSAIGLMRLGQAGVYLGWGLRLLFIFGIAFIMIKILFKVKP